MQESNNPSDPISNTQDLITVLKNDGTCVPFDPSKLVRWANYADQNGGNWLELSLETYRKLIPNCTTQDIHQTMIDVCIHKEDIVYSRIAARLESASINKNYHRLFTQVFSDVPTQGMFTEDGSPDYNPTFKSQYHNFIAAGIWSKENLPEWDDKFEEVYQELSSVRLEYWQIKQWSDKYSIKADSNSVERPISAFLANALAIHGNTQLAFDLAEGVTKGIINLPTPTTNGCRNGDWDSISCCLISCGDSVDSLSVGEHVADEMTAKKAGIGIVHHTRSIGDEVKNGRVAHLGKNPLYKSINTTVKRFTQLSRGGSATVNYRCTDPEIIDLIMCKTSSVDINKRIDNVDFCFQYNAAFLQAVINKTDWVLYSLYHNEDLYNAFYTLGADEYNAAVEQAIANGMKHERIDALHLVKTFLNARLDTGRVYCMNMTRANTHTPFKDLITQTNLCFTGDTEVLISGDTSPVKIKDLGKGFQTASASFFKGWEVSSRRASARKVGTNVRIVRLYLSNGSSVDCTPDHKIATEDGHYIEAIKSVGAKLQSFTTDNIGNVILGSNNALPSTNKYPNVFIVRIEDIGVQDVYCLDVEQHHNFFVVTKKVDTRYSGILVHNCAEIALPTKPYTDMLDLYVGNEHGESHGEVAFCSIAALNVSKVPTNEYEKWTYVVLATIDSLIDRANMLTVTLKNKIRKRRSIAIGMTGLASFLHKRGLDYTNDPYTLKVVHELAERHYFYLLKASQRLAEERGAIDSTPLNLDWLPIDTRNSNNAKDFETTLPWESLRGKPRRNSVLVGLMPTESSAPLSGGYNGPYPPRGRVIYKQSRKGVVQFIGYPKDEKYLSAWEISNNVLAKFYSLLQDFTDQAISADYYLDYNKYPQGKVPMNELIIEWVTQAALGNKTMYYQNFNDYTGGTMQDVCSAGEVFYENMTPDNMHDAQATLSTEQDDRVFEGERGCSGGSCSL